VSGSPAREASTPEALDHVAGRWLAQHEPELARMRRYLHAHPELGRQEYETTRYLAARLAEVGLRPVLLPHGCGLWVDVGTRADIALADGPAPGRRRPTLLLRADIDALPLDDETDTDYRSVTPGVSHACGHDVHTTILLGTGLALAARHARTPLPGTVRLLFQPAEELMPGGSLDAIDAGVLTGVSCALALHCDPAIDVGQVGLRVGPVTAASDQLEVRLRGPGGHTSRPQNTVDLIYALGRLVTELPAALTRLVDPRTALCVVWGQVSAGSVPNAIPRTALARGTVRLLDRDTWQDAPGLVERVAHQVVAPYGAEVSMSYTRGVPPVVNEARATRLFERAAVASLGADAVVSTGQSLGGEDFAWYLEHVPGALARLGTRTPGGPTFDLHQGRFDVDEGALAVGVHLLTAAALLALEARAG
jgi:amidohydrolase